ncbi:BREAST CANCER TYPE 2 SUSCEPTIBILITY PROTEIN BRCA2 [Salix purpurea]|uniref:BREAST CANCER TYPE 2 SUSCEPTIBILITY PROTEIN BRCA2 n=1 Tax=Salix purpurea TaxID=77065 RepID=A0A9Q0SL24_SALPP|nr:BREAST CANCER TYPE 2 SUSCEPTIBILITY PROTEIN BRCA2 [Salix purpurea]
MSTWKILSDAGNNFRWEVSGKVIHTKPQLKQSGVLIPPPISKTQLPSMGDLLLQGCPKLLENGNAPIFRTGSGKSVALKQSSIAKALSVLRDDDDAGEACGGDNEFNFSKLLEKGNEHNGNAPIFRTGLGKLVALKQSSIAKALSVLGGDDDEYSGNPERRDCWEWSKKHCSSNSQGFKCPRKSSTVNEQFGLRDVLHPGMKVSKKNNGVIGDGLPAPRSSLVSTTDIVESELAEVNTNLLEPKIQNPAPKPLPIKFHTAGGRSLSVSSEALKRARSLLGDPDLETFLNEEDAVDQGLSVFEDSRFGDASSNKENEFYSTFTYPRDSNKHISKTFISPLKSSANHVQSSISPKYVNSGSNLIKKFDAVHNDSICKFNNKATYVQKPVRNGLCASATIVANSLDDGTGSRMNPLQRTSSRMNPLQRTGSKMNSLQRSLCVPLPDISNTIGTAYSNNGQANGEKRKLGRGNSISPFKKPRNSKFTTPLSRNVSSVPSGLSAVSYESSSCRRKVSTRYPFQAPRMYIKEYFGGHLSDKRLLEYFTDQVRQIKSNNADKFMFCDESGLDSIGAEAFYHMLVQSGALSQYASKEWVINHYKWIVWKLACYERCCPEKSAANFLSVSNVLEELKYRYEREVNHGHRSAIKRILEGDAPPSSMMVLCISSIYFSCEPKVEVPSLALNGAEHSDSAKLELTDGWYSVDALLDISLSMHLDAGRLFVGQKLRIWGAGLCGWVGPVSSLEASKTVSLSLHINGTYRAHWADRMGFCKGIVGVTRIYPVLYKDKLSNGGKSIVRSERMEAKQVQMNNKRRSLIIEGIVSEFQRGMKSSNIYTDIDSEGAKILKILETSAEPEVLMAEMSPQQLASFASYQSKVEALRQLDMEKAIGKALQDAGLGEREVTPFIRVRVVGLTNYQEKGAPKEGLVTIWNPTEKQKSDLVEGQAYDVAGLLPVSSDSNTLYIQARGSTTKWQPLSSLAMQQFQPFFSPRVSVFLSNLGEVPLCREFDIAALVLHVGDIYTDTQQKKQWVFVTDSSISTSDLEDTSRSLLAISFCSPYMDNDSFTPINYNLVGSTIGLCNLIKRANDQTYHLSIAESTENSTYSLSFDSNFLHLKNAAASTQSWAKTSTSIINKLKEKVLFIIGD